MNDLINIHLLKDDTIKYGLPQKNICLDEKLSWVKFLNREVTAFKELEKMTGKFNASDSRLADQLSLELRRRKAFLHQVIITNGTD